MCALFGELSIAERVLIYRVVYTQRQARELGVFSFVARCLRLWEVAWGQGEVSGLVCDSEIVGAYTSLFLPNLSGSLFGTSKGVNAWRLREDRCRW